MGMQRFLAAQFRKPSGWFGSSLFSRFMNRINRKITDGTIALLELSPGHHVLEIGFGGGASLGSLAKSVPSGKVSGIDLSPEMVAQAERRFHHCIAQGRMQVHLGDVSRLPFPDATFDRVLTVNTIYFWPDTLQGLREIRRVLKDGGRAAISIRSAEKMQRYGVTKYNFRLFSPENVTGLMRQVGFRDVTVDHQDRDRRYDQAIVIGSR